MFINAGCNHTRLFKCALSVEVFVCLATYVKGKAAEAVARRYFEDQGYEILFASASVGPDLILKKGDQALSVEVKSAFKSGRSWVVGRVTPNRKGDDLVAIVLPNNHVFVRSMGEHLDSKSGRPSVNELICSAFPEFREPYVPRDPIGHHIPVTLRRPRRRAREEVIELLKKRGEWAV